MIELDYIVLDLDGGEMLTACLRSIDAQREVKPRIIVVDNGSRVPASVRMPKLSAEVVHVRLEENRGFAGGANAGIAASRTELVALINNDVLLDPRWGSAMAEAMHDRSVAAAQSVIATPDGAIDGAGVGIQSGRFVQIAHGAAVDTQLAPLWGVSATAAMYRRAALDSTRSANGVFDERFFAYYEDVELAARLLEAGWSFRRVDQLLAVHAGSATAHRLGSRRVFLVTRNRYYVARLHRSARRSALMNEDLRRGLRAILRAHFGDAIAIASGVVRGVCDRLRS